MQGVSTRKVAAIVEQLCGTSVSSTQVSECTKLLDTELKKWRERPLGGFPSLVVDARYEKVRLNGQLLACAVLLAMAHQKRLRTSNAMERVNEEIKRRTRVARLFPNEASLLRLVTALLAEISEAWESGKIYLNLETTTQPSV